MDKVIIGVTIDQDVCIGSGCCLDENPSVFEFDESGLARVKAQGARLEAGGLREIADLCPVNAIKLTAVNPEVRVVRPTELTLPRPSTDDRGGPGSRSAG